ncbi:unnamed protein product [Parajaminaea phylloscopi]
MTANEPRPRFPLVHCGKREDGRVYTRTSPDMSEFAKDSLSLEETNKLRISLGLKPLTEDAATETPAQQQGGQDAPVTEAPEAPAKSKDEEAEDNFRRYTEQEAQRREDEEIRQRIARAQNRRDLRRQLRGPTLGEADSSDVSSSAGPSDAKATLKWLKQAQRKAKEHAAKRAKELEEQEAAATAQAASYGENDLAGIRVAHDADEFDLEAGEEGRILTLRDSKILDGDEDELMDSSLAQREFDRRNEERKKGPKQYTGLEDEDDIQSMRLKGKRGVLEKYDADIPGGDSVRDLDAGFRIGGAAPSTQQRSEERQKQLEEEARLRNRTLLSLDYSKNEEMSDYLAPGDVGFKKSKTKKKKRPATKIKLDADDEDAEAPRLDEADAEMKPVIHTRRVAEDRDNLVDDDELAASLAKARRNKAKRAISKITPEQIAKNLAAQKASEQAEAEAEAQNRGAIHDNGIASSSSSSAIGTRGQDPSTTDGTQAGLTFDETSEFVRTIGGMPSEAASASARRRTIKKEPTTMGLDSSHLADTPIPSGIDADSLLRDGSRASLPAAKSETDYDDAMASPEEDGLVSPPRVDMPASPETEIGTAAEPEVGSGMAATLNMLRSQGILESMTPEQREREKSQRSYDLWKAKRMAEEALRDQERQMSKLQGSAKDQATREYENRKRELEEARRAEDRFRDYRPDVEIKYHDQYGRELNNHEAWKLLSHTFHGKMPGRAKQEKYKRKVEEERKRERMAAGEASDMSKAFRERQARQGQAHMVLSVGARGNAPQDFADALGPNLVQRSAGDTANGTASAATGGVTSMVPRQKTHKGKGKAGPVATGLLSHGDYEGTASTGFGLRSIVGEASTTQGSASPVGTSTPLSDAPRMRPAFRPVEPAALATTTSTGNGTGGGTGFKLSLSTNNKRKATGDPEGQR